MNLETLVVLPDWEWPAEAPAILVEVLRDREADAAQREVAAELAGSLVVMNEDLAEALLDILHDPRESDALRGFAAIAFGPVLEEIDMDLRLDPDDVPPVSELTGRRIRSTLHELYLDADSPTYVRRRVLEASIRHQEGWHEGAIRAAYHTEDPEWRLTAVFCMGHVPGFEDSIVEALDSSDPATEREALRAAGARGVTEAWTHIRRILRTPGAERELLLTAIEAAAWVRPDEAPEPLVPLLDSADPVIADAAEDALGTAAAFGLEPDD